MLDGDEIAFDDGGHVTQAVAPVFPDEPPPASEARAAEVVDARVETAKWILDYLARDNADAETFGRRGLLMRQLFNPVSTQRDLANKCGVSAATINSDLNTLRKEYARICRGESTVAPKN